MLVYANHAPDATDALAPLVTMVAEAMVFQSVTTFCAGAASCVSSTTAGNNRTRHTFISHYLQQNLWANVAENGRVRSPFHLIKVAPNCREKSKEKLTNLG